MTLGRPVRTVVVDASAMVEVLIGNEAWTARLAAWQDARALILAPTHLRSEIGNALLLGVGLSPADAISRLFQLFQTGVDLVDRGLVGLFDAMELGDRHRLSVYDALYLSLALDVDGELATEDGLLAAAAHAEGAPVIE